MTRSIPSLLALSLLAVTRAGAAQPDATITSLERPVMDAEWIAPSHALVVTGASPATPIRDAAEADSRSRTLYDAIRVEHTELPEAADLAPFVIELRHGVWWVIYREQWDGLPIEGTRFDLRLTPRGELLYAAWQLTNAPARIAAPALALDDAREAAIEALAASGVDRSRLRAVSNLPPLAREVDTATVRVAAGPDRSDHLTWIPWDGGARLAYRVRTELSDPPARFVSTIDALSGELISRENEFRFADYSGHAEAEVQLVLPSDPMSTRPLEDLRISVAGIGSTFADESGNWSLPSPDGFPRQITSALTGRYAKINDVSGPEPSFSAQANPGVPLTIHWNDLNSEVQERDAFYHINIVHDWIKAIDPSFTALDYEMPVNVNLNQTCNAFWDGTGVNFFKAGSGCTNTAQVADVVYHEYGHGDVEFSFAPAFATSAEHEGFADYHACSLTGQPLMGRGMSGPGTYIRNLDNDVQFPAPECNGEGHCVGQVIGGALWHMRQNLVAKLGPVAGVTLADQLFHAAFAGRSTTFEGYLLDLLAVDDDNGTLLDGTPHAIAILPAFKRHNLGPGYVLQILHQAHRDTDQPNVPLPITAVFDCPADLIADSLAIYYSTGPVGGSPIHGPTRLAMLPTGGIREFSATIPGQPLGTEVRYWVAGAADTLGLSDTSPDGAPANQHVFLIELDGTPPTVQHEPIFDRAAATWPISVEAHAQDNQTLAAVQVEWKKNGVDQPTFALSHLSGDLYKDTWVGGASEGNVIAYRIRATDSAQTPNVAYSPSSGYYVFNVTHAWTHDCEHGAQDVTHTDLTENFVDQWHLSSQRGKFDPHSWKFGDPGDAPYADRADGALLVPPMHLATGAFLKFWFWIQSEEDTGQRAWDAGIVEISTNGGSSWSLLTPQGGYTHILMPNSEAPLPPNTPCWAGAQGWIQTMIDLSSFAGTTAQVRFHFASDGFVGLIGWYVDDLVLDPGTNSTAVDEGPVFGPTALLLPSPNPFAGSIGLRFALAEATPVRLEVIDIGGRRIRTLINGAMPPGPHTVDWNGRNDLGYDAGAGVYFARLLAGERTFTQKLLRVR